MSRYKVAVIVGAAMVFGCGEIVAPVLDDVSDGVASEVDSVQAADNAADCVPSVERCDGEDNDCDGETDEGFNLDGVAVGQSCGMGVCEGGVVLCQPSGITSCSSSVRARAEACGNALDDDCDGATDEGCDVVPSDIDGDGFDNASDCSPFDAAIFPGAPESCCLNPGDPACDSDCDGIVVPCPSNDADGDGYLASDDCNDNAAQINPGAYEKCGNGVDEDCSDGDLSCSDIADADGDGYANDIDCEPDNDAVFPGAIELCDGRDNDCDGLVDEGNPGGGVACEGPLVVCGVGVTVCSSAVYLCTSSPPTSERCDGVDNDCDGLTDEDFAFEGGEVGNVCQGVGHCGLGTVECLPSGEGARCSSNPGGSEDQSAPEECDGIDNDCNGATDDGLSFDVLLSKCSKKGVCDSSDVAVECSPNGVVVCDYDSVKHYEPGVEQSCDGRDNNCDGYVDETFGVGAGCFLSDSANCAQGRIACAGLGQTTCEAVASVVELCDGLDNDCDGLTDEGFDLLGAVCDGDDSDQCANGQFACAPDGSGAACLQESVVDLSEVCSNTVDDDCDGATDESPCTPGS